MYQPSLATATADELRVMVQEFQASLQTALARIHSLKSREKQLMKENADLRALVRDIKKAQEHGVKGVTPEGPVGRSPEAAGEQQGDAGTQQNGDNAAVDEVITLSSVDRQPLYVSYLDKQIPVYMYYNGRKVPGSLMVSKNMVEFVEVRARIESSNFLGITVAKDTYIIPQGSTNPDAPTSPPSRARKKKLNVGWCVTAPNVQHEEDQGPYSDESNPSSPHQVYGRHQRGWQGESGGDYGLPRPPAPPSWEPGNVGAWKIVWKNGDMPQQLTFEASKDTREFLHKHTEKWLTKPDRSSEDDVTVGLSLDEGEIELSTPVCLVARTPNHPCLSEPSRLISHEQAASLAAALPNRFRLSSWTLAYSTKSHGISLQTLYRKAAGGGPSVLIVKDQAGFVFGSFTAEHWRVAPRFFGTGETFVFQLEPHALLYTWNERCKSKNDYFMYAQPDCLGVGGCGRFAVWLDSELLHGTSGTCATFGSPCLAHAEEFKVMGLELWHLI